MNEHASLSAARDPKEDAMVCDADTASRSGWGVECPMCHRRVVTPEVPCECGFRFPRGFGERTPEILDVEARDIRIGDDLFGYGVVTRVVWVGGSIRVGYGGAGATFYADEVVTVRRG